MMKKIAALGLTAALVFAPLAAFAQDATPAPTPAAGDAAPMEKPMMKKHKMMHHSSKHMMKHKMMHKKMMKKMDAPAADATPAADAPK